MNELQNVLQIPITFEANQSIVDFQINAPNYNNYLVVNPKVNTFQSWLNVSEEIGNNKVTFKNYEDFEDVTYDDVKKALYLRLTEQNIDDSFYNSFRQGVLNDPTINCFNQKIIPTKYRNDYYNENYEYQTTLIDPILYEVGTFDPNTGLPADSTTRIRMKDYYTVNGDITFKFGRNVNSTIQQFVVYVYNPDFSFNSTLSLVNWQDFQPVPGVPIQPVKIQIPFNQGYMIKLAFKNLVSGNISPIDLNTVVFNDIYDISTASQSITSSILKFYTQSFYLNVPIDFSTYNLDIFYYDEKGNYISTDSITSSPFQKTIPNLMYGIIRVASSQINFTVGLSGNIISNPSNDPVFNRMYAQNAFDYIIFGGYTNQVLKTITIPDGYYSGLMSSSFQTGFLSIVDLINNDPDFISLNGELTINTISYQTKFLGYYFLTFSEKTSRSGCNRLFGYYNDTQIYVGGTKISPNAIDFYSDGRFSTVNIIFTSLASMGYQNESTSLIAINSAKEYGSLISERDISYKKLIPKTSVLNTLSFRIVDNTGNLIKIADRLFLRFEILAYN